MDPQTQVTKKQVTDRLEEQRLPYRELLLENNFSLVVSALGGRIFGPFDRDGRSKPFWINPRFLDRKGFEEFRASGLPLGGERIWISPEIQYGVTDRTRFWETLFVPPAVDPGSYALSGEAATGILLTQEMVLDAYNLSEGRKHLSLERRVQRTADPLRNLEAFESLARGVTFTGYRHTVRLADRNPDQTRSEAWSLIQLQPGGEIIVPTLSRAEYADYFAPAPEALLERGDRQLIARITGDKQYKIGVKAATTVGRAAYFSPLGDGRDALIIRSYPNNASLPYADEPPGQRGNSGFSTHVYNDDGRFGGFGELENMGTTIGGSSNRHESLDLFELWVYIGVRDDLRGVARTLLGVELGGDLQ